MAGAATPGAGAPRLMAVPAFVGRESELAACRRALAGEPAIVLVEGEAGVGKSRLLREVLDRGLVAFCPPFREPYTLGPIVDAVRQAAGSVAGLGLSALAGALRPLFPEWADGLPPAPEPPEDARAARHLLFRALDEVLDRLRVSVLAVEDAHWADEATLEFLLFLAARHPLRTGLVVTYRPDDVPQTSLLLRLSSRLPATGLRLTLEPLDVARTGALVSSMLDDEPVSPAFAQLLHRHTDGVPLAVEESVRLLYERADLTRRNGEWARREPASIDVPPTVRDAVLERVARLRPAARAVLQAAAVLSAPADEATLTALVHRPDDHGPDGGGRNGGGPDDHGPDGLAVPLDGLGEALASGLLRDDGGSLSFRHVLASRAVYEAIPPPRRRATHLRAGRVLASRTPLPVPQLARHFREAGDVAAWRRYAEWAADLALATADEAGAASLLYDLVTHQASPPADAARLVLKIPFSSFTGDDRFQGLVRSLRAALEPGRLPPEDAAETRYQLGRVLMIMEEYEAGRAELKKAVAHLPPGSLSAARIMTYLGWPREPSTPAATHLRWLRRAAAAAESVPAGERLNLLVERATALLLLGEEEGWAEARRMTGEPADAEEARHLGKAFLNLGDAAVRWGRYGDAACYLARAELITERHRFLRYRDVILATRLHLDWHEGRWRGLADRAAGLVDNDAVQPVTRLEAILVAALLRSAAGDAGAGERFEHVLAESRRYGAVELLAEPAAALCGLLLANGDVEQALRVTDEPVRQVAEKGIWLWAVDLAPARVQALVAAGRTDEAGELVGAFAAWARGRDAPAAGAGLVLCRAILAEVRAGPVEAAAAYGRAADAWQRLPRPYDALLAQERQVACLLAAGETEAALPLARLVHQGLTALGARAAAERLAGLLRAHQLEVRGRGRRGYGDQLSPRELEVVRLLATGKTNREIAAVLSRSPRTVAAQVNSAMRKLGVNSRTALAVGAVEAGLVC
ncbi:ATP-binding protein [Nonomuraea harbinensis]|uniref:ATP-binding protein n=1 Tax=Nonomuraea harbinensis TaxID=1286938 RepID=A0ABW1BQV0_9ACTN|nr:helix-turn-helix transcriptional regulator [Nonomuraea harbinensis]